MKTSTILKVANGCASLLVLSLAWLPHSSAWADTSPPPEPAYVYLQSVKAAGLRISAGDFTKLWWWGWETLSEYGICTTRNTGYSWVTGAQPATYSMDIAHCEGSGAHLLLLPANGPVSASNQATNSLDLSVALLSTGGAQARLVLKLDAAATELASVTTVSPVGSWSLTLESNKVNLRGPYGVQRTCEMPTSALAAFADPLYVYCFAPQQTSTNSGYLIPDVTISRIQVIGVPCSIDEQFSSPGLDTNLWQVPFPAGSVFGTKRSLAVAPKGSQQWLCWPMYYFYGPRIQVSSTLAFDSWQDLGYATNVLAYGSTYQTPLPAPTAPKGFFRMVWDWVDNWWEW